MALSTANTPQVLQESLDQSFSQQLKRYRLINDIVGMPELSRRQRIPGHNVQVVSEPSIDTISEEGQATASDMTFAQATVGYAKRGARTITSNELVQDFLAGVNDAPDIFATVMASHARGLVSSVNSFIISELDSASGITDNVAAPSYSEILEASIAAQGQDENVWMLCSAAAKGSMAAEQAAMGASGFFPSFPVASCIGWPAATIGNVYAFSGDLESSARCSVEIRHQISDQSSAGLAIEDKCEIISWARCWFAISDATRILKSSYAS